VTASQCTIRALHPDDLGDPHPTKMDVGRAMGEALEFQDSSNNHILVGGLEHDFYDFPYIGSNHPN